MKILLRRRRFRRRSSETSRRCYSSSIRLTSCIPVSAWLVRRISQLPPRHTLQPLQPPPPPRVVVVAVVVVVVASERTLCTLFRYNPCITLYPTGFSLPVFLLLLHQLPPSSSIL